MGRILIAPDSFKDSISSMRLTSELEEILNGHKIIAKPMADGGENTLKILKYCRPDFQEIYRMVEGPLGNMVHAFYLYDSERNRVFIELAQASGIELLAEEDRNCMYTSTYGTGQLIKDALYLFPDSEIILFLGSSSTNDAGTGIAEALGAVFYSESRTAIKRITGEKLSSINRIDLSQTPKFNFTVSCDVVNPLYGSEGAAYTYARQKGANEKEIEILDSNLRHLAHIIENESGVDLQKIEGGGAAGGVGAGMFGMFNARLESGFDLIQRIVNFEEYIAEADLLITGEGCIDEQSQNGKLVSKILTLAKEEDVPVFCLCGVNKLNEDAIREMGIAKVIALSDYSSSNDISEFATIELLRSMSSIINAEVKYLIDASI